MLMSWNASAHSDAENVRWCWLRSVEWLVWPAFISPLYAPILLLSWPPWAVLTIVAAVNLMWAVVRSKFLNAHLAAVMVMPVTIGTWPICLLSAVWLFAERRWGSGILAIFYPAVSAVLPFISGQIGVLQQRLLGQLGYSLHDSVMLVIAAGGQDLANSRERV